MFSYPQSSILNPRDIDSPILHSGPLEPRRYRRRGRTLRAVEARGRQLRRVLPVSQREDAVVHRQPDQAVLPLLRLRRARHCDRFHDRVRGRRLHRRGQRSRAKRRHADAGIRPGTPARQDRGGRRSLRGVAEGRAVLPPAVEKRAARDRISEAARIVGRSREGFRHRLRAGWLAKPAGGVSRLQFQGAGGRRAGDTGRRRQTLRSFSRPRHVSDRRSARQHHRFRRARARQGRAEVSELARDRVVRERARALRPVSRGGARSATPAA